ncbi:UNVERIFIED_CONTAM: hypothetical protein RMT77_012370 [Armadillidium vulgare]
MMRKRTISIGNNCIEPIDNWLENNHLHRKQVPRDASCLFRAIAELVCFSQSHHETLRNLTLDYMLLYKTYFQAFLEEPLEKYAKRMRSPFEWGSKLELVALGFIFKTDFVVFNDDCLSGAPRPNFNFGQKMLYRSSTNHYDIVYPKEKVVLAGFCQALVYDILYSKVFKMENVCDVVDSMLHENSSNFRHDSVNSEGQELDILRIVQEVTSKTSHINLDTSIETSTPEKGLIPPFPYRVAKALDPTIYRNSDYDTWIALKREARFGPYDPNGLQIGAKVIIKTNQLTKSPEGESPAEDHTFHGHIQFMTENQGPVEVFAEELGRRITVPYGCLEKLVTTASAPKYCYRDNSFLTGSPQTYRMLSSFTKKPNLPFPENYNSPARGGKVKKKNVNAAAYSLPDPILPQNVNKQMEETEREMSKSFENSRVSSSSSFLNSSDNSETVDVANLNENSNEATYISGSAEVFAPNSGEYQMIMTDTPLQQQQYYQPCYDPCCVANQYLAYNPYGEVCGCCYVPYSVPYYYVYPEYPQQYMQGEVYNYPSGYQ